MPNKCAVPGCKTGYASCKVKLSIFSAPKNNDIRDKWQKAICSKKPLTTKHVVCEKHFTSDQIIRNYILKDDSGKVLAEVPLKCARLEPNAIPSKLLLQNVGQKESSEIENLDLDENILPAFSVKDLTVIDAAMQVESGSSPTVDQPPITSRVNLFSELTDKSSMVQLPDNWHMASTNKSIAFYEICWKNEENGLLPITRRSLTIDLDMKLRYAVHRRFISPLEFSFPDRFESLESISNAIEKFAGLKICCGIGMFADVNLVEGTIGYTDDADHLRHKRCRIVTDKQQCSLCKRVKKSIYQRKLRIKKRDQTEGNKSKNGEKTKRGRNIEQNKKKSLKRVTSLDGLKKKLRAQRYALKRAQKKIQVLKNVMQARQEEVHKLKTENVLQKCEGRSEITDGHRLCIKEIIAASGAKDSKGRRYTEDWVMLCILLHIRAPSAYEFLRKNGILPVPCVRTIRRYLSMIDLKCGFDKHFFEVFEKHIRAKPQLKKHGLLLFDEISLREAISVSSTDLTFKGLVDFGDEDRKAKSTEDRAKMALVLMFQPLADKYTQPIAVFASRGPVKGVDLAKLVTKALVLLENTGAVVHGVVSDGAETNRKMWSEFGVSGKVNAFKNWFIHPCNDNRKVFVFSDTPHLIKCIRNRLCSPQTSKRLRVGPNEPYVQWKHFETLYHVDTSVSEALLRICPKLTLAHLELPSARKMKVKLATQLFSNSVANGLTYYKARGISELQDCESTIDFCKKINDLFDALNRKTPNEGLTCFGNDMKILQLSLDWLNTWEKRVSDKKVLGHEFLTGNTSEGLRVTIQSTMDICRTLTQEHGFEYVLTGRINQDSLEKFFGIIRQAAGANDHPATPTFLQLYKLLSIYSILKPPTSGNCTVHETSHPNTLITLSDLRSIYGKPSKTSLTDLKTKLDGLIEETEWEFDDVVEHDYTQATVVDCAIYYVTGYVCKQIERHFPCETCRKAIRAPVTFSQHSEAALVNLKSRGGLTHPNMHFFSMFRKLEECFSNHIHSPNVYIETVNDMLQHYKFSFSCTEHSKEILSYAIKYYLRMRMRQYSQQTNKNVNKLSAVKKKQAKFYST